MLQFIVVIGGGRLFVCGYGKDRSFARGAREGEIGVGNCILLYFRSDRGLIILFSLVSLRGF